MAPKFKRSKIKSPGIYEIRVYFDKKDKKGNILHKWKLIRHLKWVNVFLKNDVLMFRNYMQEKPVDMLWEGHNVLQRRVKHGN